MDTNNQEGTLSEALDTTKMPGHWLLARLGKRVLRPGGRELTRQMLNGLCIKSSDDGGRVRSGVGFYGTNSLWNRNPLPTRLSNATKPPPLQCVGT